MKVTLEHKYHIQIVVAVFLSLVFLIGAGVFTYQKIQEKNQQEFITQNVTSTQKMFQQAVENEALQLKALINLIDIDASLKQLISDSNRSALLDQYSELYQYA